VNNTFYRLPEPETFADWRRRTPADFVFVLKASRYLTHIKRLQDPGPASSRFLQHARRLGNKLGPILLELPPNLRAEPERLDDTLRQFRDLKVAVEFRHDSWYSEEVRQVLTAHGAALCLADRGSAQLGPLWKTADWTYLRMHEGRASPHPCYGSSSLRGWAGRLAQNWSDGDAIFVFFNNDSRACAPRDAARFASAASKAGLTASRVPQEVRAG
jgi:uncharacterized protein YecE (DUF72 family)